MRYGVFMKIDYNQIHKEIIERVKALKWSGCRVAKEAGISHTTYTRGVKGELTWNVQTINSLWEATEPKEEDGA